MLISPKLSIASRVAGSWALCSALTGVAGCDGSTRLSGSVKDASGTPIRGAAVSLAALGGNQATLRADTVFTQSNGFFQVQLTHSPLKSQPLRFQVEHDGFRSYVLNFTYGDRKSVPQRVVLDRMDLR
jgi:hypothetical protein